MEPTAIPSFTGLAGGQEGDVYERRLGHCDEDKCPGSVSGKDIFQTASLQQTKSLLQSHEMIY